MSIIVSDLSYHYSNQDLVFGPISFSVASDRKVSLIGHNGTGKTTLLRLLAGELNPSSGSIVCSSTPYYIPQRIGVTGINIAGALSVAEKMTAFYAIMNGSVSPSHYDLLAEDWDIEARCHSALAYWNLSHITLDTPLDFLSGGEKTKVFLAGLMIHKPSVILLDEPTNHLDDTARKLLYEYIGQTKATFVVVSHDVSILNQLDPVFELSSQGIARYGGNYDFYKEQKSIETSALHEKIQSETKSLREARKKALEVAQRQEKRACQGEKNKMQLVRALRKTLLNRGENTSARLHEKHARIVQESQENLSGLRRQQDVLCEFRIDVQDARLHQGKRLISVHDINFEYIKGTPLWNPSLDFEIFSGERIRITGDNGTGKTTLIRLLTGELAPAQGEIKQSDFSYVFLDQEYTRVCTDLTVFELAQQYNRTHLQDHELKIRLNRALLPYAMWDKRCMTLSGGEKMRLYLCCLMIFDQVPDLFVLDEPTNNLDLSGLAILSQTIRNYRGTLLVISHDAHFIHEIGITRELELTLPDSASEFACT